VVTNYSKFNCTLLEQALYFDSRVAETGLRISLNYLSAASDNIVMTSGQHGCVSLTYYHMTG
jgi:hypothetical protein